MVLESLEEPAGYDFPVMLNENEEIRWLAQEAVIKRNACGE